MEQVGPGLDPLTVTHLKVEYSDRGCPKRGPPVPTDPTDKVHKLLKLSVLLWIDGLFFYFLFFLSSSSMREMN